MTLRLLTCAILCATMISAHAATYVESTSSDLSGVPSAPTLFALDVGANSLSGSAGQGDFDLLHFVVPAGSTLTSLTLDHYVNNLSSVSFVGLEVGATWTAGLDFAVDPSVLIGASHLGSGTTAVGKDLLVPLSQPGLTPGFQRPLAAGDYVFLIQDTDNPIDYSMTFNVAAPSTPGDFTGNGAIDGADLAQWTAHFGNDAIADADDDADSDGADFLTWQRNITTPATSVPEPAAWIVWALGVWCWWICRDYLRRQSVHIPAHARAPIASEPGLGTT